MYMHTCTWSARGIPRRLHCLARLSFRFRPASAPINLVSRLASDLHQLPSELLLGSPDSKIWDLGSVAGFVAQLNATNVLIRLGGPMVIQNSSTEPWYGTPYNVSEVSAAELLAWTSPAASLLANRTLPASNPFIPLSFEALPAHAAEALTLPSPLRSSLALWRADPSFNTPEVLLFFSLDSTLLYSSRREALLTSVWNTARQVR